MLNGPRALRLGIAINLIAVVINSCSFSSVSTETNVRSDNHVHSANCIIHLPLRPNPHHRKSERFFDRHDGRFEAGYEPHLVLPGNRRRRVPAGMAVVLRMKRQKSKEYSITVTEELQPDKDAPYYLDQRRNWVFDDENHFIVNKKYLLTSSHVTAQDRTPDIIGTTAKFGCRSRWSYYAGTLSADANADVNERGIYTWGKSCSRTAPSNPSLRQPQCYS